MSPELLEPPLVGVLPKGGEFGNLAADVIGGVELATIGGGFTLFKDAGCVLGESPCDGT